MAALQWEAISEAIGEKRQRLLEPLQTLDDCSLVLPGPQGMSKTWVVPPCGMKTGAGAQDAFAFLQCRREWPGGHDEMRVGQVFQQEVPRSCVGVPSGVKAAQELLVWSGRGHLIVKGNFLSTSVPIGITQTVGTACL